MRRVAPDATQSETPQEQVQSRIQTFGSASTGVDDGSSQRIQPVLIWSRFEHRKRTAHSRLSSNNAEEATSQRWSNVQKVHPSLFM